RPGDQHLGSSSRIGLASPTRRQIPVYTAQEIATLQARLEKKLGPEYLSSRSGPGGQKVHYVAAEKCIQLANEVFGFNGWSSQIMDCQVDFVDENPQTLKVSLGLSVVVRVTLKDGTFHEDVGYGHIENCKGKAAAFEKAKKEGTTDALKRALRNFGNVLGNCIYDKEYLKQVSKVKPFVPKWSENDLFRHNTFTSHPAGISDKSTEKKEPKISWANGVEKKEFLESDLASTSNPAEDYFEDEFGDFDEADFSVADPNSHPDEVMLSDSTPPAVTNNNSSDADTNNIPKNDGGTTLPPTKQAPAPAKSNGSRVQKSAMRHAPQTPVATNLQQKPTNKQPHPSPAISILAGRSLIQPNRTNDTSKNPASIASAQSEKSSNSTHTHDPIDPSIAASGFYSARAATLILAPAQAQNSTSQGPPDPIPPNAPAFNPHAESPSIRKTPGVDHRSSKPLTRDLRHVPSSSQALGPIAVSGVGGNGTVNTSGNILNPSLDYARKIGAPMSPSPMGMTNGRSTGFRMPMKRPTEGNSTRSSNGNGRIPLDILSTNGVMHDGNDPKKPKVQAK
ncbi:BgTH12-04228, partial [Blumeria graminis f. sp. triticale]